MQIGVLPPGEPGVFRSLLLPEAADALARGEALTALGLTETGLALGAAAGYLENSQFQLISLYVAPAYRQRGGGRMLVDALLELLPGHAAGVTVRFTVTEEEHRTIAPFLAHLGFAREDDHGQSIYLTTLSRVMQLPFYQSQPKGRGTPLCELPESDLTALAHAAQAAQAPLPPGGLHGEWVEKQVSVAYLENGVPQGYVIGDTSWPGGLTLSAVWSSGVYPTLLVSLLRIALARAVERYAPETALAIQTVNARSAELLRSLLPDIEPISFTYRYPLSSVDKTLSE